ncbi:unnamed protein product [Closterium sp. Yama58-4]|nr:unnamed protein product [Closterium sp. Yama58-4]
MARLTAVLTACVLLCAFHAEFAHAQLKTQGKLYEVGSGLLRYFSPWNQDVVGWIPPRNIKPGDIILFRWLGRHDVRQFPTIIGFSTCSFFLSKTLASGSYFGFYRYIVKPTDKGTTLYFGSSIGDDCQRDMKVAIPIP